MAEVERLLAAGSSTQPVQERTGLNHLHVVSEEDDVHPATAAAELGNTAVVDALLSLVCPDRHCLTVGISRLTNFCKWSIACQRSNFAIAASVLSVMEIHVVTGKSVNASKPHLNFSEMFCLF